MNLSRLILTLVVVFLCQSFSISAQDDDCVFDLDLQTSEFLKETKYWDNHHWHDDTKKATIKISNTETLEIIRGGCAHYNYYVKLAVQETTVDLGDMNYWIGQIQAHTHELKDFDNQYMDSLLTTTPEFVERSDDHAVCFYKQTRYCNVELYLKRVGNKTMIEIGYYRC